MNFYLNSKNRKEELVAVFNLNKTFSLVMHSLLEPLPSFLRNISGFLILFRLQNSIDKNSLRSPSIIGGGRNQINSNSSM